MALFARICVLRGFPPAAYREVAFLSRFAGAENPCAALIRTKIAHLWIGNAMCPFNNCGWAL